ncbi:MAG: hypothetical protein WC967_09570 [Balneolaceae bacterium]
MISNKLALLLLLLIFMPALSTVLYAQELDQGTSKLKITTNYDSFYVLVGDSLKNARLEKKSEFFDIESGLKRILVIPQYSDPYYFEENFQKDSVYVLGVTFYSVLRKESKIYSQIQYDDLSLLTISNLAQYRSHASSGLSKYTIDDYDRKAKLSVDYKESYLKVLSNVDSLFVSTSVYSNQVQKIASGDSILVKPSTRAIYLSHRKSIQKEFKTQFSDSSTTTISHDFKLNSPTAVSLSDNIATKPAYNANLIVVSDHDSDIIVNEVYRGTGAIKINQETGPVDVTIVNKNTGKHFFTSQVLNTDFEKAVVVNTYTKPNVFTTRFFTLFPGASQMYKRQKLKGYALSSAFLLSGAFAIVKHNVYKSELSEFNSLQERYEHTTNPSYAIEIGDKVEKQHKIVTNRDNERRALFTLAGLIYAFNLYDGLFTKPKGGFQKNTDIDFYLNNEQLTDRTISTLTLRYDF